MTQGDVYWHTFKEPDKRRPVLLLTRSSVISYLNAVTVAPITTTKRNISSEVLLGPEDGLWEDCAVNLDNIQTVPKAKLGSWIAHLAPEQMRAVRDAIMFAFAFERL